MAVISCITIGGCIGSFAFALGVDYAVNLSPPGAGTWVSIGIFLLIGGALLATYLSYSRGAGTDA